MRFGAPGLKDNPVFISYAERLNGRPAWQRVNEASGEKGG
jgi:hypothetical protein